jgi:inner membrane protein
VDNITHSLVGVALADLAAGGRATKAQRPLLVGAGIIAANLPDIDLAYTAITPLPIGYLLHHRGHTHTVVGLAGLALALVLAYWFFPSVRKMGLAGRVRFWLLIAIALASHLALDALNTYGVHPFFPADNRWYFGDAVFILEPALWVILGVAVSLNSRTGMARLAVALPLLLLLVTAVSMGAMPIESAALVAIAGGTLAWGSRRLSSRARSALALAVCGIVIAGLASTAPVARRAVVDALRPEIRGQIVDVVLTPNPSSPLCWSAIAIEKREAQGEYVLWRGTLSLAPAWRPPARCGLHAFFGEGEGRVLADRRFVLSGAIHQPLRRLRALAERDCWVRAWLRFGRAPVIADGSIYDLRFRDRPGDNFSFMRLEAREGCPRYVPDWAMPRADLLISR